MSQYRTITTGFYGEVSHYRVFLKLEGWDWRNVCLRVVDTSSLRGSWHSLARWVSQSFRRRCVALNCGGVPRYHCNSLFSAPIPNLYTTATITNEEKEKEKKKEKRRVKNRVAHQRRLASRWLFSEINSRLIEISF